MKKTIALLVLVAALAGTGLTYWHRDSLSTPAFRTARVQRGDLVVTTSATGPVEPEEVVDVGAQVAGQILEFGKDADGKTVDYGTLVDEGTVLARIDESLCSADVTQAQAQVLSAQGGLQRAKADLVQMQAKLHQAEGDWERARQLGPSRALAASDYDNYKSAREVAQANLAVGEASIIQAEGSLAQAQSLLDRARRNLGYCTIKSPVKGVVIDRRVNIGQTVVASLNAPSLFLIAKDLTRVQVWVAVNEADIARLHRGQPVTFTVDAFPGETFQGAVGKIRLNASMTQNVVTYTVEVTANNSDGRLLPYLTANVSFELDRHKNVLMVPNAALQWTPQTEQIDPQFRQSWGESPIQTPESQEAYGLASRPESDQNVETGQAVIWVLSGRFVRPAPVRVGLTDDTMTEVDGDGVTEGLQIVTGEEDATAVESESSNPFLPKIPRKSRGGPPPPPG